MCSVRLASRVLWTQPRATCLIIQPGASETRTQSFLQFFFTRITNESEAVTLWCGNVTNRRETGKPKRRCTSEGAGECFLLGSHIGCSSSARFRAFCLSAHFAAHPFIRPMHWFCLSEFQLFQRLNGGRSSCEVQCVFHAPVTAYEQAHIFVVQGVETLS